MKLAALTGLYKPFLHLLITANTLFKNCYIIRITFQEKKFSIIKYNFSHNTTFLKRVVIVIDYIF